MKITIFALLYAAIAFLSVALVRANAPSRQQKRVTGIASWYGESYRGKTMANGQLFDPDALTCAAWNWPLGTVLSVTYKHPRGYRSVVVTVTDRGPDKRLGRLLDLSSAAFRHLVGNTDAGIVTVEVEVVGGEK